MECVGGGVDISHWILSFFHFGYWIYIKYNMNDILHNHHCNNNPRVSLSHVSEKIDLYKVSRWTLLSKSQGFVGMPKAESIM